MWAVYLRKAICNMRIGSYHWEEGKKHGVDTTLNAIDFSKMVDRKNGVVQTLQSGIQFCFRVIKLITSKVRLR